MSRLALATLLFAAPFAALSGGVARAQGGYPEQYALRPLRLPTGMVQLKVPLVINLSRGSAGSPVNLPFEIRLGVNDALELRLFHPVNGLCLRGCGRIYNDLALGLLYSLLSEQGAQLSLQGAFEVRSFAAPAVVQLDAGVAFKLVRAPFSLALSPYVGIGISNRADNGDSFNLPIEFAIQIAAPTALFFETGLYGDAHNAGSGWTGPLGVGIDHLVSHGLDLGAEFKLNTVLGHTDTGSRLFLVYAALRNQ